jgi:hypothetical protein
VSAAAAAVVTVPSSPATVKIATPLRIVSPPCPDR